MAQDLPTSMHAVVIDQFGDIGEMKPRDIPVPQLDAGEVLIKLEYAGVGVWDPDERQGVFAEMMGAKPRFPLVLGSEGAGTVAAVGSGVGKVAVGDKVYTAGFLNPKGGTYAEYVVVNSDIVAKIPGKLTTEQAAVMGGDAGTSLRGLDDKMQLKKGESILVFGAGGGLGHLAVQLAKHLGARVLAVASGDDGVALAKKLGADVTINGRKEDVAAAARQFAPDGLDAALLAAGGKAADAALTAMKPTGRVAYPNGVEPKPNPPSGVKVHVYDGNVDGELMGRLHKVIEAGPFHLEVAKTFPLDEAAESHRMLDTHYLGKLALKI